MNKKIYALTTLQGLFSKKYGIEMDLRLFDTIEQCRKEYNLLIKEFENSKDYIVNKGAEHTEIKYDQSRIILVAIQTYELNDVVNNQVHCVIKGNQDCDYIDNENLYLFNDEKKASKKFLDLLYEHRIYGYNVENTTIKYNYEQCIEYFDFNDYDDWGYCKTELIKIES